MFKPCPKCGFLVALIAGREASQRCPRCGSALLSDSELLEIAEAPAAEPMPRREIRREEAASTDEPQLPVAELIAEVAASEPAAGVVDAPVNSIADATDSAAPETGVLVAPDSAPPAHEGPSFARGRTRLRTGGPRWPWLVTLPLLALLLAVQLLLAQRVELARDAAWRPVVMRACGLLGCSVPAWHEPQAFAMTARGVRPNAARPGALHVTATVRNDARWPQAPPVVVLSLSDVDGRVVGARAVPPRDYGHRTAAPIAPGDSVDIAFDVREPAAHVESFDFQLQ